MKKKNGADAVIISIGRQGNGVTAELDTESREMISARFPKVRTWPRVFLGYEARTDFERIHGPVWRQVALLLTGLSEKELGEIGGFRIMDPVKGRKVYEAN